MDSQQEDKIGMFMKSDSFLTDNATTLAVNPAFGTIQTKLAANIEAIVQADSTATRNLAGLTIAKGEKRELLDKAILTIAAACRGYYTTNHDPYQKSLVTITPTQVLRTRDADIIVLADKIHDVANPIKNALTPWNVTDADVDGLLTLVNAYRPTVIKRSREQDRSEVAGTQVDVFFADTDKLLREECDDHMAVYEFTNNALFLEYKLARAIDDSGGNSGSEGYEVNNFTVPAGGSIIVPTGPDPLRPDLDLYLRAINGSVLVCSTDLPASPCIPAAAYPLQQGITFKGAVSNLGIDLNKTHLQFTNPGLTDVKVRAGVKV